MSPHIGCFTLGKIGNRGKHLEPAPFAVYHAFTEEHSEPDWELYCLATKTLFGVDDSKLRDNPVIYFDWRQEINQLNRQVAKKLASEVKSDLVYIIVPTRFSEWLADSYLFDSCEAQLLKVPESIMSALADPGGTVFRRQDARSQPTGTFHRIRSGYAPNGKL